MKRLDLSGNWRVRRLDNGILLLRDGPQESLHVFPADDGLAMAASKKMYAELWRIYETCGVTDDPGDRITQARIGKLLAEIAEPKEGDQ